MSGSLGRAELRPLESRDAIASAWPVVHALRPHLDLSALQDAWEVQSAEGYRAVGLFVEEICIGFAGYRIQTMLAHGRFLYVDDLVVAESRRGEGAGELLMDWLQEAASNAGCDSLQLDSGTHRSGAHAFYFRCGMTISSYHFRRALPG